VASCAFVLSPGPSVEKDGSIRLRVPVQLTSESITAVRTTTNPGLLQPGVNGVCRITVIGRFAFVAVFARPSASNMVGRLAGCWIASAIEVSALPQPQQVGCIIVTRARSDIDSQSTRIDISFAIS